MFPEHPCLSFGSLLRAHDQTILMRWVGQADQVFGIDGTEPRQCHRFLLRVLHEYGRGGVQIDRHMIAVRQLVEQEFIAFPVCLLHFRFLDHQRLEAELTNISNLPFAE